MDTEAYLPGDEEEEVGENEQTFNWNNVSSYLDSVCEMDDSKLRCVPMTGWSMILKADFDTVIEGEPYSLICVMVCEENGQYLVRAWNQTVEGGSLADFDELKNVIDKTFQASFPCLGVQEIECKKNAAVPKRLMFPKMLSKDCELFYTSEESKKCQPCQRRLTKKEQPLGKENSVAEELDDFDMNSLLEVKIKEDNSQETLIPECDFEDTNMGDLGPEDLGECFDDDDDSETLICRDCQLPCPSITARINHEKSVHNYGRFKCSHCDAQQIRLQDYIDHYIMDHPEIQHIDCQICNEEVALDQHYYIHYTNCRKPLVCPVCDFRTRYPKSLRRHIEAKHDKISWDDVKPERKKRSYAQSEAKHKETNWEEPKQERKKRSITQASIVNDVENFDCRECQLKHQTYAARYAHEKRIHAYGMFTCDHCGISSWKFDNHITHLIDSHPDIDTEKCLICEEEQKVDADFVEHYKNCYKDKLNNMCKVSRLKRKQKVSKRKKHDTDKEDESDEDFNPGSRKQKLTRKRGNKRRKPMKEEYESYEEPDYFDIDDHLDVNIEENPMKEEWSESENDMEPLEMDDLDSDGEDECKDVDDDSETLTCRDCQQPCPSVTARRNHEKSVHNYGRFKCSHCDAKHIRLQDYIDHYMKDHPEVQHIECRICNVEVALDRYFYMHYTNCRKNLVCTACGFRTRHPKSLRRHIEAKHKETTWEKAKPERKKRSTEQTTNMNLVESFDCRECQYPNKTYAARYAHEKKMHAYGMFMCDHCGISSYKLDSHVTHVIDNHPNIKILNCMICNEERNVHLDFVGHYKECYKKKMNDMSRDSKRKFKKKLYASDKYVFSCTVCDFKTKHYQNVAHHKNMHERENNKPEDNNKFYMYCDKCEKKFLTKKGLNEHVKVIHLKEITLAPCDQCDETFTTKLQLRRHRNRVHSSDPKFNCPECGKRFGTTSDLTTHIASHTGSTRCICKVCGANVSKARLKSHERLHTGEKPFPCLLCEMRFISSTTLSGHYRQKHNTSTAEAKKQAELKLENV